MTPEGTLDFNDGAVPAAAVSADRPTASIRLVLAGHHPLTLCGLSQVLTNEGDCSVLAMCNDPRAVVDTLRRHGPDIIIMDFERSNTFTVLRQIRREHLSVRVVVLASASERHEIIHATRLGAAVVLLKELPAEALIARIREIGRAEQAADTPRTARVTKLFRGPASARYGTQRLTRREAEIARLAVQGMPTSEIAARLQLKPGTVKIHLHSVYTKLKVAGRVSLIMFARRHNLG